MMARLVINGARLDARLYALMMQVLEILEAEEIDDLEPRIRARMFQHGAIVLDASDRLDPVWRLTDWAELTLLEILNLAQRPTWSPSMKRRAIEDAMDFAGFAGRDPA